MRLSFIQLFILAACNGTEPADGGSEGDGGADGGTEACDTVWYADRDGDDFGDDTVTKTACDAPTGFVAQGGDCDDASATVNPAAREVCDSEDNDCNGLVDDDASDTTTWYADIDGDTYGDPDSTLDACTPGAGYTDNADDCDDSNPYAAPGAPEFCDGADNDCDGLTDDEDDDVFGAEAWYVDDDGDGFGVSGSSFDACDQPDGYADNELDCDDTDASVTPKTIWFRDDDGDGYGEDGSDTMVCDPGDGSWVLVDGDCDDRDAELTPDTIWYRDSDKDGYGDPDTTDITCKQPTGYVLNAGDCDDTDSDVSSGGTETWYDGVDDNCDGLSDYDADMDGYDSSDYGGDDCDDDDDAVSPDADEYCDGIDNNCDGDTDLSDAVDPLTFYVDGDGDGYGDPEGKTAEACDAPSGYVDNADDCDDEDPDVLECSAASATVEFPSSDSSTSGGTLGSGGGGTYYTSGSYCEETFEGTGVTSISELQLTFDMYDATSSYCKVGELEWDVIVNDETVGTYSYTGGSRLGRTSFEEDYTFTSVDGDGTDGDEYTIRLEATSTVCSGGGSWNWYPEGEAVLIE